jgi:hypothetical protein
MGKGISKAARAERRKEAEERQSYYQNTIGTAEGIVQYLTQVGIGTKQRAMLNALLIKLNKNK